MYARSLVLLSFFLPALAIAGQAVTRTEINGKIVEVRGEMVVVKTDTAYVPAVGDAVEFGFEIPGLNEKASAGSGTVTGFEGELVVVKVVKANGKLAKDYLATATTSRPTKKTELNPDRTQVTRLTDPPRTTPGPAPPPPSPPRTDPPGPVPSNPVIVVDPPPANPPRPVSPPVTPPPVKPDPPVLTVVDPFAPRPPIAPVTPRLGRELEGLQDRRINCFAISPDGKHVLGGFVGMMDTDYKNSFDVAIRLWDTRTGRERPCFANVRHTIVSVGFTADSGKALAVDLRGRLRTWDVAMGKELGEPVALFGSSERPEDEYAAFSPDGGRAALVQDTPEPWDTVRVSDVRTGALRFTLEKIEGTIAALTFSADGRFLMAADDASLCVWDADTGRLLSRVQGSAKLSRVAFAGDGRYAVVAEGDAERQPALRPEPAGGKPLRLLELRTGREVRRFEGAADAPSELAFAPDSRSVAAKCGKTLLVWDVETGRLLNRQEVRTWYQGLKVSDTGMLAVLNDEGNVQLLPLSK